MAACIYLFSRPAELLLSPEFRSKYGALYEGLLSSSVSSLSIQAFHNLRLSVLIPLLVFSASSPPFQSGIYLASAGLSLAWDLALSPYEGKLLSAQMLVMDVAKVCASVGYVLMTIPGVSSRIGQNVCLVEVAVLVASICGGLALATIQMAMDAYVQVRKWCAKRNERVYVLNQSSDTILHQRGNE